MLHPIEESLIITPKFIEKIVNAYTDSYAELAKITKLSLNTVKSYDRNQKVPNNSSSKKWIKGIVSAHGNFWGTEKELQSYLEKGTLYQEIDNATLASVEKGLTASGDCWEEYFNIVNLGYLFDIDFPRTKQILLSLEYYKKQIRKFFEKESFMLASMYLSCMDLPGLVFDEKILKNCSKSKSKKEFIRTSLIPCLKSHLYAIASFDIELFPLNTKLVFAPSKERERLESYRMITFGLFLPVFKKNRIKPPINRWYDTIKYRYNRQNNNAQSWIEILDSGVFDDYESLADLDISLIRKWKNGRHTPKKEKIDFFLNALFPNGRVKLERIFYVVAKIFQYIYEQLCDSGMKDEDIIDFFQDYISYCKIHLKEYKQAAAR